MGRWQKYCMIWPPLSLREDEAGPLGRIGNVILVFHLLMPSDHGRASEKSGSVELQKNESALKRPSHVQIASVWAAIS